MATIDDDQAQRSSMAGKDQGARLRRGVTNLQDKTPIGEVDTLGWVGNGSRRFRLNYASALCVEVLENADATRPNIIKSFRQHLSRASSEDVVLFQYSGHGARWKSAAPFGRFYPDGRDEGLVCYHSRQQGGFDLADKELAVLLSELDKQGPHIAVVLDCCHSGSAT